MRFFYLVKKKCTTDKADCLSAVHDGYSGKGNFGCSWDLAAFSFMCLTFRKAFRENEKKLKNHKKVW